MAVTKIKSWAEAGFPYIGLSEFPAVWHAAITGIDFYLGRDRRDYREGWYYYDAEQNFHPQYTDLYLENLLLDLLDELDQCAALNFHPWHLWDHPDANNDDWRKSDELLAPYRIYIPDLFSPAVKALYGEDSRHYLHFRPYHDSAVPLSVYQLIHNAPIYRRIRGFRTHHRRVYFSDNSDLTYEMDQHSQFEIESNHCLYPEKIVLDYNWEIPKESEIYFKRAKVWYHFEKDFPEFGISQGWFSVEQDLNGSNEITLPFSASGAGEYKSYDIEPIVLVQLGTRKKEWMTGGE